MSSLVSRNVTVNGRRTSIHLEPEMWDAMYAVCRERGCTVHQLCSWIEGHRHPDQSLTSAVRVALLRHYRTPEEAWPGLVAA